MANVTTRARAISLLGAQANLMHLVAVLLALGVDYGVFTVET